MQTIIDRQKQHRHQIAKLVIEQHRLRNEMMDLAKRIGHAQNTADLGIEVSPMAFTEVERLSKQFIAMLHTFEKNEFEKINARLDVLRLELEKQKS